MTDMPIFSGQFLLAMPGIGDPRFEHSVIALCAHGEGGAFGLCLHRVIDDLTLPMLMRQVEIDPRQTPDLPVLFGGPVEPASGFVLHSAEWSGRGTRPVGDNWSLTGTVDILRAIAEGEGPKRYVVALGYAGWGPGQLESELRRHGWFTTKGSDRLIFDVEAEKRWSAAFRGAGIDSSMLASDSGHA